MIFFERESNERHNAATSRRSNERTSGWRGDERTSGRCNQRMMRDDATSSWRGEMARGWRDEPSGGPVGTTLKLDYWDER